MFYMKSMSKFWLEYLVYPLLLLGVYLLYTFSSIEFIAILLVSGLFFAILKAVQYASNISKIIGEPYGVLVLAIAITFIELSIIISFMVTNKESSATIARDTVFAAVMIILTGMIGLSIFLGALYNKTQYFNLQGVSTSLSILVVISTIAFILPNFTITTTGPTYSNSQLMFISIVTLLAYAGFLYVQTVKFKFDYITVDKEENDINAISPFYSLTILNAAFLVIYLIVIVAYSGILTPSLEKLVLKTGAPNQLTGIIIALIILLPEGISAVKYAIQNELQNSMNLSLGSALATIGLTIPFVSILSIWLKIPITLGINTESIGLFFLSILVLIMTLSTGRTTFFQGLLLILLFAIYLFLTIVP